MYLQTTARSSIISLVNIGSNQMFSFYSFIFLGKNTSGLSIYQHFWQIFIFLCCSAFDLKYFGFYFVHIYVCTSTRVMVSGPGHYVNCISSRFIYLCPGDSYDNDLSILYISPSTYFVCPNNF